MLTYADVCRFEAAVVFFGGESFIPAEPFCADTNNFVLDKQWGICECVITYADVY
jgi:hypothetical protein